MCGGTARGSRLSPWPPCSRRPSPTRGKGSLGGATPHFNDNNNVALDQLSLFYAGRIVPHVGAFVQGTYDGVTGTAALDNVDIRAAMQGTVLGTDLVYGVSFNNNPTVQERK